MTRAVVAAPCFEARIPVPPAMGTRHGRELRDMSQPYPIRFGGHDALGARFEEDGTSATLHLAGELDLAVAEPLARLLADLIGRHDPRLLVVVDELRFCDIAGVRVLLEAHRRGGGRVVFRGFCPSIMRLLELTRAAEVLCPRAPHGDAGGRMAPGRRHRAG